MKQSYRNAIEQGGDLIVSALGKAERQLSKSPDDPRALAYKGSLLVLTATALHHPKQAVYRKSGLTLLCDALKNSDASKPWFAELVFVAAVSLLNEPETAKSDDQARVLIGQAIEGVGFADLTPFERVGLLCAAARIARLDGDKDKEQRLLSKARQTDPGLVEQALRRQVQGA